MKHDTTSIVEWDFLQMCDMPPLSFKMLVTNQMTWSNTWSNKQPKGVSRAHRGYAYKVRGNKDPTPSGSQQQQQQQQQKQVTYKTHQGRIRYKVCATKNTYEIPSQNTWTRDKQR